MNIVCLTGQVGRVFPRGITHDNVPAQSLLLFATDVRPSSGESTTPLKINLYGAGLVDGFSFREGDFIQVVGVLMIRASGTARTIEIRARSVEKGKNA